MVEINYLDLFSGIGGFHLGLEQSGFKFDWVGFSEIDKYATQIYERSFSDAKELGSIIDIRPEALPKIDLITFGFPCQDLSVAGKRKGLSGKRSGLFFEALRIIEATKPTLFVFENVKGLFSSNEGKDFETVLRAIADLGLYECEWQLLNTRWFLPQNRERVYFIGHLRGTGGPKVFPFRESDFNTTKSGEQSKSGILCNGLDSSYHKGPDGKRTMIQVKALTETRTDEAKKTRRISMKNGFDFSPRRGKKVVVRNDNISNTITSAKTVEQMVKIVSRPHGYNKGGEKDLPCLRSSSMEHNEFLKFITHTNKSGLSTKRDTAAALRSGASHNYQSVCNIRRLTPTECERLQGFPDGWTEGISDTQRYKCLGNAVSVPVVKAIGERLL